MFLKKLTDKYQKTENADTKISTKGFLIFAGIMIVTIITLVIVLSLI